MEPFLRSVLNFNVETSRLLQTPVLDFNVWVALEKVAL